MDANQEGKSIVITYDLKETSSISLYYTRDGGKTKTSVPQKYTSGDIGKVKPGVQKRIVWRVLDQYPNQGFQGEDISFIVKGSPLRKFFTTINTGFAMGAGFQVGLSVGQLGKFGWYLKGITTLSMPHTTEYECDERGVVNNIQPAYSGMANTSKAYGIAGLIIRVRAAVICLLPVSRRRFHRCRKLRFPPVSVLWKGTSRY